eukprot:CAMPEP_0204906198 /NCGR_PEP_ID=MMETSP1397-20131031/5850_1 /ASSEMBLY_ACC=CAM_ASM_000891 /TAXON_ID=49980 /ORGANISM="Climacostomum Climacostomum virens, Strain Stock W-24" /LENGTH=209 /DNA_ID=CAMNT_0052075181 /DNA_START=8 /DNA_END=637 /DNA_ORIENTATION=+
MTDTVLHYFVGRGRAEVIRFLLASNGVQYEEKNFTFDIWPEAAATGYYEFRSLPLLEIDGHKLVTSQAIERYVAKKFGLYPEDNYLAYLVESIIDLKLDAFSKTLQLFVKDIEEYDSWFRNEGKRTLALMEARLAANHGGEHWFVGDSKTWADYSIFQFIHDNYFLPGQEARKAVLPEVAPKLLAFAERFLAGDAAIQHRIATRPESPR